jgi:hypothetical protein
MPMLFEVMDRQGAVWSSPHLTCNGGQMLPAINPDAAHKADSQLDWWWFCQQCNRFVRPLDRQEALVVMQAVQQQHQDQAKRKKRQRGPRV